MERGPRAVFALWLCLLAPLPSVLADTASALQGPVLEYNSGKWYEGTLQYVALHEDTTYMIAQEITIPDGDVSRIDDSYRIELNCVWPKNWGEAPRSLVDKYNVVLRRDGYEKAITKSVYIRAVECDRGHGLDADPNYYPPVVEKYVVIEAPEPVYTLETPEGSATTLTFDPPSEGPDTKYAITKLEGVVSPEGAGEARLPSCGAPRAGQVHCRAPALMHPEECAHSVAPGGRPVTFLARTCTGGGRPSPAAAVVLHAAVAPPTLERGPDSVNVSIPDRHLEDAGYRVVYDFISSPSPPPPLYGAAGLPAAPPLPPSGPPPCVVSGDGGCKWSVSSRLSGAAQTVRASFDGPGNLASAAFDESLDTTWSSEEGDSGQHVEVDLGEDFYVTASSTVFTPGLSSFDRDSYPHRWRVFAWRSDEDPSAFDAAHTFYSVAMPYSSRSPSAPYYSLTGVQNALRFESLNPAEYPRLVRARWLRLEVYQASREDCPVPLPPAVEDPATGLLRQPGCRPVRLHLQEWQIEGFPVSVLQRPPSPPPPPPPPPSPPAELQYTGELTCMSYMGTFLREDAASFVYRLEEPGRLRVRGCMDRDGFRPSSLVQADVEVLELLEEPSVGPVSGAAPLAVRVAAREAGSFLVYTAERSAPAPHCEDLPAQYARGVFNTRALADARHAQGEAWEDITASGEASLVLTARRTVRAVACPLPGVRLFRSPVAAVPVAVVVEDVRALEAGWAQVQGIYELESGEAAAPLPAEAAAAARVALAELLAPDIVIGVADVAVDQAGLAAGGKYVRVVLSVPSASAAAAQSALSRIGAVSLEDDLVMRLAASEILYPQEDMEPCEVKWEARWGECCVWPECDPCAGGNGTEAPPACLPLGDLDLDAPGPLCARFRAATVTRLAAVGGYCELNVLGARIVEWRACEASTCPALTALAAAGGGSGGAAGEDSDRGSGAGLGTGTLVAIGFGVFGACIVICYIIYQGLRWYVKRRKKSDRLIVTDESQLASVALEKSQTPSVNLVPKDKLKHNPAYGSDPSDRL